jgi:iron(III) transport system substrate-binding protein
VRRFQIACLGFVAATLACGRGSDVEPAVTAYVSVDQNHAEPILREFEARTGIRVDAAYDVEAAKTTGLVNRLIAEKRRPRADLFWSGEFAQTILLKDNGVLAPYASPSAADIPEAWRDPRGYWAGFAGRARVFIVNTELAAPGERPSSLQDYLDPRWPAERIAIALPLFGTTATHAAALYAVWGPEKARDFFEQIEARGVHIAAGNSVVRDLVADGRAIWGLTDTDDAAGAMARGAPVSVVFPDQGEDGLGTLAIPNTVALVEGGPHPDEAKALVDFLLSVEVERRLVESGFCHAPIRPRGAEPEWIDASGVKRMSVNLEDVYRQIERSKADLSEVFVK